MGVVAVGNAMMLGRSRPARKGHRAAYVSHCLSTRRTLAQRLTTRDRKIRKQPPTYTTVMVSPNHSAANSAVHIGSSTMITTPWLCTDRLWA